MWIFAVMLCLLANCQAAASGTAALEVANLPAAAAAGEQGQLANAAAEEVLKSDSNGVTQQSPSAVLTRSGTQVVTTAANPSSLWISCAGSLHQHGAALLWGSAQQHTTQQQPFQLGGQGVAMQAAARKLLAQQVVHTLTEATQPGSVLSYVAAAPLFALVVLMMVSGRFGWLSPRRSSKPASGPPHSVLPADLSYEGDAAVQFADGDAACKSNEPAGSSTDQAAQPGPRPLSAGSYGWELSPSLTAPVVGHVSGHEVRFGKLLSGGSVSRVWQGGWCNKSVAVKMLNLNNHPALTTYEQQLQQLVSLEHPHVVRTYCGVIHSRQGTGSVSAPCSLQLQSIHVPRCTQQQSAVQDSTKAAAAHPQSSASTSSASDSWTRGDVTVTAAVSHGVSTVSAEGTAASSSSSVGVGASNLRTGLLYQQLHQQEGAKVSTSCSPGTANVAAEAEAWLVQELCDLGTLRSVALEWQIAGEGDLQMHERLTLLLGAARGLKYLHSKGIVHGDLSADNILVCSSEDSPVRMTAKVSGMGLCAAVKHANRSAANSVRALSHVAPEVQRGGRADPCSDVFAFGILMWEVFTGQQAYRKLLDAEHLYEAVVVQNLRPKIPEGMPRDYQLLLERCWASDPTDRPSLDKLLGCLSVMAAERARRLDPHAHHPPPATPAAAVAVAAAGARTRRLSLALPHTHSCDQATLRALAQQQGMQQLVGSVPSLIPGRGSFFGSGPPVWRQGSDSSSSRTLSGVGSSNTPRGSGLVAILGPVRQQDAHTGSYRLAQQKSCPASAFESLLRSKGAIVGDSVGSDLSESPDQGLRGEGTPYAADAGAAFAADADADAAADAAFKDELQAEDAMLLQLRVSSLTQSGPGSAPVLHSQPHQRHMDGLDMWPPELDDAHMWHI